MAQAIDLSSPAQLAEYESQLSNVVQLLTLTPNDPELIKLYNDLQQLVELTRTLQRAAAAPVVFSAAPSVDPLLQQQQQPPPPAAVPAADPFLSMDGLAGPPLQLRTPQQPQDGPAVVSSGRRVMALWEDGLWYVARVERENPPEAEGRVGTLNVLYLEYGNRYTVTEDQVRPYVAAPRDRLVPGANVRAVNPEDGMMYPARLLGDGALLGHYMIEFKVNQRRYEVPAYDLLVDEEADARERRAREQRDKLLSADEFELPEYLKPKETDSKQQKEAKRHKVKQLKAEFRKRKLEEAGEQKQASWLNFRSGLEKRKAKRVKTTSIFATSEQGKVGVVGSGRGVTLFEQRKKQYTPADQKELPPPGFEDVEGEGEVEE